MSSAVISVENLGKRYSLGAGGRSNEGYTALRDVIARGATAPFKRLKEKVESRKAAPSPLSTSSFPLSTSAQNSSPEEFWALKDVSFDIQQGEVVGIIGRNGAGKSTLLKILSRITDPTKGKIKIKGRVASLLEVGTGFHPELTGRENIYLNGAILGMSRAEIRTKFDEIVAFAEVEKFLDTPVKRYSSGMYVRLAFAVAAHLEPEILIVDEVLAVGDAEFQKKCLGKMKDVAGAGRTVLLVSHQLASIAALATSCILLDHGMIVQQGQTQAVLRRYSGTDGLELSSEFYSSRRNTSAWIAHATLRSSNGLASSSFKTYEDIVITIDWVNFGAMPTTVGFQLNNRDGNVIMTAYDTPSDWDGSIKKKNGRYETRTVIPKHMLPAQEYSLHLALDSASPRTCFDVHHDALRFTVHDPMDEFCITRGALKTPMDYMAILPALDWSSAYEPSAEIAAEVNSNTN